MSRSDEPPLPQNWANSDRSVPMVIVAPPPVAQTVTSGAMGVIVPVLLVIFISMAIFFAVQYFEVTAALAKQREVARDVAGVQQYMDDLYAQNARLCADPAPIISERVTRTSLQVQVDSARTVFDAQCERNEGARRRARNASQRQAGGAVSAASGDDCQAATPQTYSQPWPPQGGLAERRAAICSAYRTAPGN